MGAFKLKIAIPAVLSLNIRQTHRPPYGIVYFCGWFPINFYPWDRFLHCLHQ
jgi:hypothetical protein